MSPNDANITDPAVACGLIRSLRTQGRLDDAPALLARLLPSPAVTIDAFNLGIELVRAQRIEVAKVCFAFVLRCAPNFPDAHLQLGSLLLMEQRFLAAAPYFEAAARLQPQRPNAWLGLGQCMLHTGQGARALEAFDRLQGEFAQSPLMTAWRGTATMHTGDRDGALALYAQALARDPQCYDASFGQALIHDKRGELESAAAGYAAAHALRPAENWPLGGWAYMLRRMCAWRAMEQPEAELVVRLERGDIAGYATQWIGLDLSAATMRRIAEQFMRAQTALHVEPSAVSYPVRETSERLRVGYVSADLRDHATARLLVQMLESHDRGHYEVFAYALAPRADSAMGRRIVAACEHFVDAVGLTAAQLAARMREDRIDVMVDLHGHTEGALDGLAALRPAPVVVNYLGFPGTMGAFADYIVGDRHVTPPGSEDEFSEAIVRLPGSYQPNDRHREVGEPTTRAAHNLPEGALVACSFNQAWKFRPRLWSVWMHALRSHERLVLWLLDDNRWATANLRDAAAAAGVDPTRLVFAPRLPQAQHMARLGLADLALDTAPCNSHTTASDALWMGVPMLTLAGRSFDARVGASLLHAVSLPEFVAYDEVEYASRLDGLLREPHRLAQAKRKLIDGRSSERLWDAVATARALERAYSAMYARFREGSPPAGMDLDDVEAA